MTITAADHCIWSWAHWSAAAVPQLTAGTVQHGDGELENTIDLFNPWPRVVCAVAPPLTAACHSTWTMDTMLCKVCAGHSTPTAVLQVQAAM